MGGAARDLIEGRAAHFAITLRDDPVNLVGYVGLVHIEREHLAGELSFWIGGVC